MNGRLIYRAEAEQDTIAAAEWYESRGQGLVAEFIRAFDVATASIERNPHQHPECIRACGGRFSVDFHTASSTRSLARKLLS